MPRCKVETLPGVESSRASFPEKVRTSSPPDDEEDGRLRLVTACLVLV